MAPPPSLTGIAPGSLLRRFLQRPENRLAVAFLIAGLLLAGLAFFPSLLRSTAITKPMAESAPSPKHQVLLSSTEGARHGQLVLTALAPETGEVRWRRRFEASRLLSTLEAETAQPQPILDGQQIFAFWQSGDLIALDAEGRTLWHRSLSEEYGRFDGDVGLASSPVVNGTAVVVQLSFPQRSYLLAVDRSSGETMWAREHPPHLTASITGLSNPTDSRDSSALGTRFP